MNIDVIKVMKIGGIVLGGVASLIETIADDKSNKKYIEKMVKEVLKK